MTLFSLGLYTFALFCFVFLEGDEEGRRGKGKGKEGKKKEGGEWWEGKGRWEGEEEDERLRGLERGRKN